MEIGSKGCVERRHCRNIRLAVWGRAKVRSSSAPRADCSRGYPEGRSATTLSNPTWGLRDLEAVAATAQTAILAIVALGKQTRFRFVSEAERDAAAVD